MLENTPGPNAAVTETGWTILQEWDEDRSTMKLVTQVYDINIKQKDDKNSETSETEVVHNNVVDIDNMVAIATEKGQHAISRMLENVYLDDCNFSATKEEELKEVKENLPGFLHETGLIFKAPTYKDTRDSPGLSNSGFINTTIILQRSEYKRSDNEEEDSGEDINDGPLFSNAPISVGNHRNRSVPPSAVSQLVEEDHNVHQSLDLNRFKIPELLNSVEVSASVSLSREQELIDKKEGPGRENNQICKRSMGLRKAFTK